MLSGQTDKRILSRVITGEPRPLGSLYYKGNITETHCELETCSIEETALHLLDGADLH